MAEFEEKLQAILSDPQAMGQIASLAQALTGGAEGDAAPEAGRPPEPEGPEAAPDLSALLGTLGGGESPLAGVDPGLLQAGLRLLRSYSARDDERAALLAALKPFVRPERYAGLDRAVRAARLARVLRAALKLFRDRGEEDAHV